MTREIFKYNYEVEIELYSNKESNRLARSCSFHVRNGETESQSSDMLAMFTQMMKGTDWVRSQTSLLPRNSI